MGNICGKTAEKVVSNRVAAPLKKDIAKPDSPADEVHVVICALDYKGTSCELTCSQDGRNMEALCQACGISDVTSLYDNDANKDRVQQVVEEVASRCEDGHYFIFYYSGHGSNMRDVSGDEEDGQDEAFCFVGPDGSLNADTFMSDDDFAAMITEHVPENVKVLILTDCCHSGTIADLDRDEWNNREAISITGCLDGQTSGDMGKGGIFTHSMLLAIDKLQDKGEEEYSVGAMYNVTLDFDEHVFNSEQDITIQTSAGVTSNGMAWPLIPTDVNYKAPLSKAQESAGMVSGGGDDDAGGMLAGFLDNDDLKQQLMSQLQAQGVPPQLVGILMGGGGFGQMLDLDDALGHH